MKRFISGFDLTINRVLQFLSICLRHGMVRFSWCSTLLPKGHNDRTGDFSLHSS